MQVKTVHSWDLSPGEAISLQKELAKQIVLEEQFTELRYVAACDVSFNRGEQSLYAAVVVLDRETGAVIEEVSADDTMSFPYIPGLLSFRELPIVLQAFRKLQFQPDVVVCDGQGVAHPRGLGIASHLGLWLDIPTIGCAKSLLCGKHGELGESRGATSPIVYRGKCIGQALRTRVRVKPVYVSPGNRCSMQTATELVLQLSSKYRLPDPIRMAHNLANEVRKQGGDSATRESLRPGPKDQASHTFPI